RPHGRTVGAGGQGRTRAARRGLLRGRGQQPEAPAGGQESGRAVVQRPPGPPPAGLRGRGVEEAIHRFVRLLRRAGVRVGVSEAIDAMRALTAPGIATDRELTRAALRVSLIKDRRDERTFDRIFDLFFRLRPVEDPTPEGHGHAHDDLSDQGELDEFTLSENPEDTPQQGHSHGKPVDIRKYFDEKDLAAQYNLHQEANRLDMASLTDEIVLSNDAAGDPSAAARVQLTTSRLHNPGRPGDLASHEGLKVDAELSVAQEQALLSWLGDDDPGPDDDAGLDTEELAALRNRLAGLLGG